MSELVYSRVVIVAQTYYRKTELLEVGFPIIHAGVAGTTFCRRNTRSLILKCDGQGPSNTSKRPVYHCKALYIEPFKAGLTTIQGCFADATVFYGDVGSLL